MSGAVVQLPVPSSSELEPQVAEERAELERLQLRWGTTDDAADKAAFMAQRDRVDAIVAKHMAAQRREADEAARATAAERARKEQEHADAIEAIERVKKRLDEIAEERGAAYLQAVQHATEIRALAREIWAAECTARRIEKEIGVPEAHIFAPSQQLMLGRMKHEIAATIEREQVEADVVAIAEELGSRSWTM